MNVRKRPTVHCPRQKRRTKVRSLYYRSHSKFPTENHPGSSPSVIKGPPQEPVTRDLFDAGAESHALIYQPMLCAIYWMGDSVRFSQNTKRSNLLCFSFSSSAALASSLLTRSMLSLFLTCQLFFGKIFMFRRLLYVQVCVNSLVVNLP